MFIDFVEPEKFLIDEKTGAFTRDMFSIAVNLPQMADPETEALVEASAQVNKKLSVAMVMGILIATFLLNGSL